MGFLHPRNSAVGDDFYLLFESCVGRLPGGDLTVKEYCLQPFRDRSVHLPLPEVPGMRRALLVLGLLVLAGCTSFRERETVGSVPTQPFENLRIMVSDTQITRVGITYSPGAINRNQPLEKAQSEVPLLQQLLKQGAKTDLKSALSRYVNVLEGSGTGGGVPLLSFSPIGAMVECGNLNVVCQASLRVNVSLIADRRSLWTATYKVGAPMNGTNDAEVMRVFFADVISRLESHRFIRRRAAS